MERPCSLNLALESPAQLKKKLSFQITSVTDTPSSGDDSPPGSAETPGEHLHSLSWSEVKIVADVKTEDAAVFADSPGLMMESHCEEESSVLSSSTMLTPSVHDKLKRSETFPLFSNPPENGMDDLDRWKGRFRIVKIASTEPYRRMRWSVHDYYQDSVPCTPRRIDFKLSASNPSSTVPNSPSLSARKVEKADAATTTRTLEIPKIIVPKDPKRNLAATSSLGIPAKPKHQISHPPKWRLPVKSTNRVGANFSVADVRRR
jgi:hypothetical protein